MPKRGGATATLPQAGYAIRSSLTMQPSEALQPSQPPRERYYTVPVQSPLAERLTQIVAIIAWLYGLYWLTWRWTETINWSSPVFSLVLVIAETYGLVSSGLLLITVWRMKRRASPAAPDGLSVDVFITCYDEPLQLLRRTALGVCEIQYPHKSYILDDGKRDEVKELARELGIGYLRREGNAHAKAGNLNEALKHTNGEFILQLDADHVPLPSILDGLVGYFEDEKVAFVQSPQDFYNTSDSFTHVVNDEGRRLWEENRIFFSLVQPGKDTWNAAFFCGSCGMLRRAALEDIGGFSTLTITEDMETSIILHSRGWKSVYHGETLAYGLAPASAGQYHVQRLRWGQGSMQILRRMNPLFQRGLDWRQRLLYFASVFTYFDGLQKLVFYASPLIFFYTGAIPVRTTDHELLIRLVPYMILTVTSFELLSRGTGWILISERYNMTKFWTYIMALSALFTTKPLKFNVTPKAEGNVPWRTYAPQLTLAILSALAIPFAAVAYHFGWIVYRVAGLASAAFFLNSLWVCWNLYFAAYVVRHSVLSRQQRADYRFLDNLPIEVLVIGDAGVAALAGMGITQDINASGLSFKSTVRFEPDTKVQIPLNLTTGSVTTLGTVLRAAPHRTRFGEVFEYAVRFNDDLPISTRDAIELHCTQHSVPFWQRRYRQSTQFFSHLSERFRDLRIAGRRQVRLPAVVRFALPGVELSSAHPSLALLEEVSSTGARIIMDHPVTPGSVLRFEVQGSTVRGEGVVVFNRAFKSPRQVAYAVGVYTAGPATSWWRRTFSFARRQVVPPEGVPPTSLARDTPAR